MKVLVVGLGAIGQRHVRNLRALLGDELELLALRTRGLPHVLNDALEVESADGLCEKYEIRVVRSLTEAIAWRPTAAFVCNPTSLHIETALALARAGCHLFVEKPLSHAYAHVEELIEIVQQQHLVATVGYQLRFHPCLLAARDLLRSDAIGRVVAVRAQVGEYLPNWHRYEDYRGTYGARRALGGGTLLSQIHEMDYLYWFFGLPETVFTVGGHLSSLDVDVEDVSSTLMRFANGGLRFPVHLHQDYLQRPASRTCQIVGDGGRLEIDLLRSCLLGYGPSGALEHRHDFQNLERNELFMAQTRAFVQCVQDGRQATLTLQDAAQSLRMALAAKESLANGTVVTLSETANAGF
jgi:predicted dehydrogenase